MEPLIQLWKDTLRELALSLNTAEMDRLLDVVFPDEAVFTESLQYDKYTPQQELPEEALITGKNREHFDQLITFAGEHLTTDKFLIFQQKLGQRAVSLGEYSLATDIYRNVIRKFNRKKGYGSIVVYSFYHLGDIFSRQAQWKESLSYLKKAAALFSRQGDKKGAAMCENLLGVICGEKGEFDRAREHMEKALSILNHTDDKLLYGMIENNLGILNTVQGNQESAYLYYCRAKSKFEDLHDFSRFIEVHHNIGMMFLRKNNYEQALNQFSISIKLALKEHQLPVLCMSYSAKAFIYVKTGDIELAEVYAARAMDLACQINDKLSVADIHKIRGMICSLKGEVKEAESYFLTSLRLNRELQNRLNYAETALELGMLYIETNRKKAAAVYLKRAMSYYGKTGRAEDSDSIRELLRDDASQGRGL